MSFACNGKSVLDPLAPCKATASTSLLGFKILNLALLTEFYHLALLVVRYQQLKTTVPAHCLHQILHQNRYNMATPLPAGSKKNDKLLGCGTHTDCGFLTILYADGEGLEVCTPQVVPFSILNDPRVCSSCCPQKTCA